MDKIKGNVSRALDDVFLDIMRIVLKIGMDEYGPVPEETGLKIAEALGNAIADVRKNAEAGGYSE